MAQPEPAGTSRSRNAGGGLAVGGSVCARTAVTPVLTGSTINDIIAVGAPDCVIPWPAADGIAAV